MPITPSVQNNFTGGLKTEFTGLNFPENAAIDTENCVYSLVGDVTRRGGIDFEADHVTNAITATESAISTYRWKNAGGDGQTEVLVLQSGSTLYFYQSSASTTTNPLSGQLLTSTVNLNSFLASGSTNSPVGVECQFTDGNGYLFVYHPYLDPFYCVYSTGTITPNVITVQIRDFAGIPDALSVTARPNILSNEHNYNIQNQGWGNSSLYWSATTSTLPLLSFPGPNIYGLSTGFWSFPFTSILNGGNVIVGQAVNVYGYLETTTPILHSSSSIYFQMAGVVTGYNLNSSMQIDITSVTGGPELFSSTGPGLFSNWTIIPAISGVNQIATWNTAFQNYPSNADIWWAYKNTSGVYDPVNTIANIQVPTSPAAQGHFILQAFNQLRSSVSGVGGLTNVFTTLRPKTGAWFQGRVFYAGCDASQSPAGDAPFYTWSENIYFSQIVTEVSDFGLCYQTNDPTDEDLFDLLPSDGGVIQIQGCGSIYKLFPIQNGLLVFASNGVWFLTGSQGIGFAANDYTVTKISSVQSISSSTFISILGLPIFWNEEGIYAVEYQKSGGLAVNPLTIGTILTFYNNIPLASKKYARGDYNPITYIVQWVYRSTQETDTTSRYQYDSMLCLNTANKAFYPYDIGSNSNCYIHGSIYMNYPSGAVTSGTAPDPTFKYLTSVKNSNVWTMTFSEENNFSDFVDWFTYDGIGVNFDSYFITGYRLEGKAVRKFGGPYILMYSRTDAPTSYCINSIWDFASSGSAGRNSSQQLITIDEPNYEMVVRRHKLRGHGYSMQIKVQSVAGLPFDIMGWSEYSNVDDGF